MSLPNNITFSNLEELNDTLTSLQNSQTSLTFKENTAVVVSGFMFADAFLYCGLGITFSNLTSINFHVSFVKDYISTEQYDLQLRYGTGVVPTAGQTASLITHDGILSVFKVENTAFEPQVLPASFTAIKTNLDSNETYWLDIVLKKKNPGGEASNLSNVYYNYWGV